MEVHRELGKWFNEVVYGDALKVKFIDNNNNYSREVKYAINYKDHFLSHKYKADFIADDKKGNRNQSYQFANIFPSKTNTQLFSSFSFKTRTSS